MGVAELATGLSGREFLEKCVGGEIIPPICATLGFVISDVGDGHGEARLTPEEFHFNPIGSVHGGIAATLLDTVTGCAVHSKLPVGTGYTTLSITVNYLRPISTDTGEVRAVGTATSVGRRVATAEGVIYDAEGRKLATATATCLVLSN